MTSRETLSRKTHSKMKIQIVSANSILVALFVLLISSSLAEDELFSEAPHRVKDLEQNYVNSRSGRQISFLSNWLDPRGKAASINNEKKGVSSKSSKYLPGRNTTQIDRDGRFLSLFTIIRYENTECMSSSGDNGTCYPNTECTRRGGAANGRCAQGYGVCCVFSKSCGASTNQNCTYFTHTRYPSSFDGTGSCQLSVYKCAPDICQYKLEFDSFNIAQPNTEGVCIDDQFVVSGTTSTVPVICGSNSGNHMFIDVGLDNSPVTLSVITSGQAQSRSWKIKVTQLRCNTQSKAPEGCLQYYRGVSGTIRSYNFDFNSGQQLSNQDYSTCIRSERNFCGIRYVACPDNGIGIVGQQNVRSRAFSVTGDGDPIASHVGARECQRDWIIIPCATNTGRVRQISTVCQDRICGDVFNSEESSTQAAVYSYVKPFVVTYHTDSNETTDVRNRGFCLNFVQQPCTSQQYIQNLQ